MADSYEINLEIQGGEQPALVMETESGATDGASARNAEAWANGTRNGVPVEEGDPAYHNNSKYYRDSAAAIVAGDIIDDDAGRGDTMLTWSADKLVGEFGGKAPAIVVSDTTPEAMKTFPDGADGMPMGLTVGIEPVQDLHGQENPYPGGAGKNMFDMDGTYQAGKYVDANGEIKDSNPSSIQNLYNQKIAVTAGADYTVSGSSSANAIIRIVEYTSGDVFVKRTLTSSVTNPYKTITIDSTTAYIIINPDDTITNIQVESGSSKTDFAPYSNVCPISGWTGVNVTRTGKNLLNPVLYKGVSYNPSIGAVFNTELSGTQLTDNHDGTFSLTTSSTYSNYCLLFPVRQDKLYHARIQCESTGTLRRSYGYLDKDYKVLSKDNSTETSATINSNFVPSANPARAYWFMEFSNGSTASVTITFTNPMINFNHTVETYEPYQGETYEIAFPSSAGTVYGGNLTVNVDGTGTLVVDKFLYAYDGTEYFNKSGTALNGFYNQLTVLTPHNWPRLFDYYGTTLTDEKSSMFIITRDTNTYKQNYGYCYLDSGHNFNVPPETFGTTVESFKAKLAELYAAGTPVSVFCKIAEPQVYTLTAPQVETLKGMNNLWADTGDIKAMDYPADTKLYIDGKIAALQAMILENISNS